MSRLPYVDDGDEVVDNLDIVPWRQSLDVTVLKDRLAVRQKGKRQATAIQRKIKPSHHTQTSVTYCSSTAHNVVKDTQFTGP